MKKTAGSKQKAVGSKRTARAKRSVPGAVATGSLLREEAWAMATDDLTHFGCTYDEALALANTHPGGTVMTDAAAGRINGFNELIEEAGR